ncbi:hypothetical protein [Streptomyces sp. NPDC047525]|uniref:hypothetical protein n=1 Tax=Streptomyces sp. NPDC047525 TaxID=3155264 RepID=UPI0034069484
MTPAAVVLPDAAVRLVRAVAGRRALQVVLLLACLLALGFLCGERAEAVDGAPSAPERAQVTEPVRERVAEPVREQVGEPVRETAREAVRHGRQAVRDAAVEPVADAAEPVARTERTVRGVVGPVVDGVTGVLGGSPQRVLPAAPDMPELPLPDPGAGNGDDADAGSGAEPQSPESAAKPGDGRGGAGAGAHEARKSSGARGESSYGTGAGVGTGTAYPAGQQARGAALFGGDTSDHAHGSGHEPFPSAPGPGDPARTLGGQSAGDGSQTRHGDPCAASSYSRAPVRLLQGAGAGQVLAPIRERHRDIPEFPG